MFTSKTGKLLIVLLLTCVSLFSQHIDEGVQKYVDLFKYEANRRGINGEYHIKQIKGGIFLVPLPKETLGLFYPLENKIELNSVYYQDEFLMKWTLFHEIGHSVGLVHIMLAHDTVMQPYQPITYFFITEKDWQIMLNEFFQKTVEE